MISTPVRTCRLLVMATCLTLAAVSCGTTGSDVGAGGSTSAPTTTANGSSTTTELASVTTTTVVSPTTVVVTTVPVPSIPDDALVLGVGADPLLATPDYSREFSTIGKGPCEVLAGSPPAGPCGVVDTTDDAKLVWFSSDDRSARIPVIVVTRYEKDLLTETVELRQDVAAEFDYGHVESGNIDGHPGGELAIGVRSKGEGSILDLSIVDSSGEVGAAFGLENGRAAVIDDALEIWTTEVASDTDRPNTDEFEHYRVAFDGRHYRLVALGGVATSEVPKGQFP